jgi:hypothetical protein
MLHVTPMTEQLDVDGELSRMKRSTSKSRIPIDAMAATTENVYSMLSRSCHEILHLSCHCAGGRTLLFEDELGGCHSVGIDFLSRSLRDRGRSVRLVVVNACDSIEVARSLVGTWRAAIGVRGAVSDLVASHFTQNLYMSLSSSNRIERTLLKEEEEEWQHQHRQNRQNHQGRLRLSQAFDMAVDAIRVSPQFDEKDANRFVLFPASGGLSSVSYDPVLLAGPTPEEGFISSTSSSLPALSEDFVGREIDVYRTLRVLSRRRVVVLSPSSSSVDQSGMG